MRKITIVVRKFNKSKGGSFYKATCKGKFLNLIEANDDVYYNIRLHKLLEDGTTEPLEIPQREGFYDVALESRKDIWLDTREEMLGKDVCHIKTKKILFVEPLPTRTKIEK